MHLQRSSLRPAALQSQGAAQLPALRPSSSDTISKEIRAEGALLRYLHTLLCLRGRPHLALATTATRVRLQVSRGLLACRS